MTRKALLVTMGDMDATLTAQPPAVEVLRPLAIGTIVRLPDDSIAEVTSSTHAAVAVVHGYLLAAGVPGAGPWIYERHCIELASEIECDAYHRMCRSVYERTKVAVVPSRRSAQDTQPLPTNWRQAYVGSGPERPAPSAAMREESRMVTQQLAVLEVGDSESTAISVHCDDAGAGAGAEPEHEASL